MSKLTHLTTGTVFTFTGSTYIKITMSINGDGKILCHPVDRFGKVNYNLKTYFSKDLMVSIDDRTTNAAAKSTSNRS